MSSTVFVVGFSPAGLDGGVGGFEWSADRDEASGAYDKIVRDSKSDDDAHVVRLVEMTIAADNPLADREGTTEEIDSRLEEVESTLPAIKQYVPVSTVPEHIPSAGLQ